MKLKQLGMSAPEERFDIGRGAIAKSEQDDLGRMSKADRSMVEVDVLGYDDEVVGCSIVPYVVIIGTTKAEVMNVCRIRIHVAEQTDKPRRDVLIEEEPHAGMTMTFRPRSAAKAKQARISRCVR